MDADDLARWIDERLTGAAAGATELHGQETGQRFELGPSSWLGKRHAT